MSTTRSQQFVCANSPLMARIAGVNQELWLLLSMFVIAGLLNWVVAPYKMLLGLYMLPTLLSAYVYGRNHAVLTASASILIVVLLAIVNPTLLIGSVTSSTRLQEWLELTTWGGLLLVTAYLMGTLYQRQESHLRELRRTYFAVLAILQQFVSNDKYTHNHCHRVAIYAATLAGRMGLDDQRVDDIRAAALLHDLANLDTSKELLRKAANAGGDESSMMKALL
jgi:HD domain